MFRLAHPILPRNHPKVQALAFTALLLPVPTVGGRSERMRMIPINI